MRTALERELHNNTIFRDPSFKTVKQKPGGKIYLTKSEIECPLPVSQSAKALLQKRNFNFKGDAIQKANSKIKTIGSLAGINTVIRLGGVPLGDIMKLGGWKKLQTLQLYLRASGVDVARIAEGYDFFK